MRGGRGLDPFVLNTSGVIGHPEAEKWLSVISTRAMEDNHSVNVECIDYPASAAHPERHPSQTMIDEPSAIQQLVCGPGQGMCDTFEFIAVASFSCVVFSASESKNVANCLFCKPRRFLCAASDVITDLILAIQARKTPHFDHSLLRILPSRTHPPSIPSRRITAS